MKETDLVGKVALVTGASSGIGKAICERLAQEGVKLALAARSEDKLKRIASKFKEKYQTETLAIPTDVRDDEQVDEMVQRTINEFGKLDILVNNAGIIRYADIENFSTSDYKAIMETNCDGMFYSTRAALPHLKESKGNIIFIGSFDSKHPRTYNPIYPATKWWTRGFAHSIEAMVGKDGVGVTLVNPSEVRTEIPESDGTPYREAFDEGEITEPEEIAEVVVFAAKRSSTTTLSEVDVFRRNKLGDFF
ncbi:MAG: SDR family oxidoreductase [Thermoplasmatota archaeon]